MLRKKQKKRKNTGFSLIELIAAMIIMGLLAGTVALGVNKMVGNARVRAATTQISSLGSAISTFNLECGFYPPSLQDLIQTPTGRNCKNFPPNGFLEKKEIPNDPWEESYNYQTPGTHNTDGYDLWSKGPDKEDGTTDDITNWAAEK